MLSGLHISQTQNSVIYINTISFEVYENYGYYINVKNIIQIKNLTLSHAINLLIVKIKFQIYLF